MAEDTPTIHKQFYYKNNRLQQLRGFYYTAQFGSVSKAAEHMYLNQSTVSMQIKALEDDLNVKLFTRHGPKISLTEDGQILYDLSLPHIEGIDSLYQHFVTARDDSKTKKIVIAANHVSIVYILPHIIKKYQEKFPDIEIIIHEYIISNALEDLLEGKVDIIIGPMSKVPNEFIYYPVFEYSPVLITPKNHPLAKIKRIKLQDIAKYPFVHISPHLMTMPTFWDICQEYNFTSNINFSEGDWVILKEFVRAGVANAVSLSMCINEVDKRDMDVVDLSRFFPKMSYGFIVKKSGYLLPQVLDFAQMMHPEFVRACSI